MDGDDSSPSHYDELPDIRFDLSAGNKISPAIINSGITVSGRALPDHVLTLCCISYLHLHLEDRSLLDTCFLSQPPLRLKLALIQMVAPMSGNSLLGGFKRYSSLFLFNDIYMDQHRSAQERIFFHVVLNPAHDMRPFNGVYYDAVSTSA